MKKMMLSVLLTGMLLTMVGCSFSEEQTENDSAPQELNLSISENYTHISNCNDIIPYGLVALKDSAVICDMENNCLREFDFYGNEIRRIGQLGNGNGEFINPSGLAYCDEKFYVVDAGNKRIQILNADFEYQEKYTLSELTNSPDDMFYSDIAVCGNGRISVLTNSVLKEEARVYLINLLDDSLQKTSYVMNGYTCSEKDQLYYINTFKLSESDSSCDAMIQESSLYELVNNELCEVFQFPYKYGPTDFIIDGNDLYVLSCVWAQLDHFTMDGSYVETIWEFDSLSPESCLAHTLQGGFVVTDRQNGTVHFLNYDGD